MEGGNKTIQLYDRAGQCIGREENGYWQKFHYAEGHLSLIEYSDGSNILFSYDGKGRCVHEVDLPSKHEVWKTYDACGNLIRHKTNEELQEFQYNERGDITYKRRANNYAIFETQYEYRLEFSFRAGVRYFLHWLANCI